MESIQRILSQHRHVAIAAIIGIALLLVAIIGVLIALLVGSPSADNMTNTTQTSVNTDNPTNGSSNLSGSVSSLSGSTTSTRNLKGLTLRINQIETCNPSVVSAYVAVSSDSGVVNTNFKKSDVKVYLDDQEFTKFDFNPVDGNKTPLSNVLVIDHSGSMSGAAIANAKSAATQYVQKLRTGDQVGVIQFDDRVETLVNVTADKTAVINAIGGIQARGDTAVYDALADGVSKVPNCGRKAVTILTDGDDTASKSQNSTSVVQLANKANLPVFSVGIKGEGFNPATIKQISDATGGQYLEANTPAEIDNLYANIDGQLTGQFVANLKLSIPKDSKEHTLKIVSNVEGSPTTSVRNFIY